MGRNSNQNTSSLPRPISKQGDMLLTVDSTLMNFAETPIITIVCLPAIRQNYFFSRDDSESVLPSGVDTLTQKRTFKVHRSIIVTKSTYFKACLSLGGMESSSSVVTLNSNPTDEHDAAAVAVIVQWMYYGKVALSEIASHYSALSKDSTTTSRGSMPEIRSAARAAQKSLTAIYIQADKLALKALQNDVLDVIRPLSTYTFGTVAAWINLRAALPIETQLDNWFSAAMHYWINKKECYITEETQEMLRANGNIAVKMLMMKSEGPEEGAVNPVNRNDKDFHDKDVENPLSTSDEYADDKIVESEFNNVAQSSQAFGWATPMDSRDGSIT